MEKAQGKEEPGPDQGQGQEESQEGTKTTEAKSRGVSVPIEARVKETERLQAREGISGKELVKPVYVRCALPCNQIISTALYSCNCLGSRSSSST